MNHFPSLSGTISYGGELATFSVLAAVKVGTNFGFSSWKTPAPRPLHISSKGVVPQ